MVARLTAVLVGELLGFHLRSERRTAQQHGAGDGGQNAGADGELNVDNATQTPFCPGVL